MPPECQSAAVYGRLSQCFRDSQKTPFCFRSQLPSIRSTALDTTTDGLVHQPNLTSCSIPRPSIRPDSRPGPCHRLEPCCLVDRPCLAPCAPPLPAWPPSSSLEQLPSPLECLDLGSDPDADALQHASQVASKLYYSLADTWLPLAPVRPEQDEALAFPSISSKLRLLLRRELNMESLPSPVRSFTSPQPGSNDPHLSHGRDPNTSTAMKQLQMTRQLTDQQNAPTATQPFFRHRPHPCLAYTATPPLTPPSDVVAPYILEAGCAVIDLTSDPSSPPSPSARVRQGCIDSDIVSPSSVPPSPFLKSNAEPENPPSHARDLQLDLPVTFTSPIQTRQIETLLAEFHAQDESAVELPIDAQSRQGDFEDAFAAILYHRQVQASGLAVQEKLNPSDSISRLSVPLLDFEIPPPDWTSHVQSGRLHLSWLQDSMAAAFSLPLIARDPRLESRIRWAPIPRNCHRISTAEEMEMNGMIRNHLAIESSPNRLSSSDYLPAKKQLSILEQEYEEEIEAPDTAIIGCAPSPNSPVTNLEAATLNKSPRAVVNLGNVDFSPARRRKAVDEIAGVLPRPNDTKATSRLLSAFMEIRAIKKPRLSNAHPVRRPTQKDRASSSSPTSQPLSPTQQFSTREQTPAPAPEVAIPAEKGPCIVSLGLGRPILRCIQETWGFDNVFDQDYSQHDLATANPGLSTPAFEADISLSSSIGVIVTTLVKVKQKPLPGSRSQTAIRQRVEQVCGKYEELIILVSHPSQGGNITEELTSSDAAAYADFVLFTVGLDAGVTSHLVPGAVETLAKWILSLMSRHNDQMLALRGLVSHRATTWDMFFRTAGMNIVAAQVLSKALFQEFGDLGLAHYITMPMATRQTKYGQLLGGGRLLRESSQILDWRWNCGSQAAYSGQDRGPEPGYRTPGQPADSDRIRQHQHQQATLANPRASALSRPPTTAAAARRRGTASVDGTAWAAHG